MHHLDDTDSLLHGSDALLQRAYGGVGGILRSQARFWEAATHDDLVIALSGLISIITATMGFSEFCRNLIDKKV